jgi:hypothetical protein
MLLGDGKVNVSPLFQALSSNPVCVTWDMYPHQAGVHAWFLLLIFKPMTLVSCAITMILIFATAFLEVFLCYFLQVIKSKSDRKFISRIEKISTSIQYKYCDWMKHSMGRKSV